MNATTKPTPKAIAPEVLTLIELIEERDQALETTLYNLSNIVKLAAFAVEARRTLEGHVDALRSFPAAEAHIFETVEASQQWVGQDDVCGEVLTETAMQLAKASEATPDYLHQLRKALEVAA